MIICELSFTQRVEAFSGFESAYVSYFSVSGRTGFISSVTFEQLEQTPPWKVTAPNPPLAARDAMRLTDALKDKLVKNSEFGSWIRESTELHQAGGLKSDFWYWLIRYELDELGSNDSLSLIVLMNGEVISPEVVPARKVSLEVGRRMFSQFPFFTIRGEEISDSGLKHLANWADMNHLEIYDCKVTDSGISHLSGLRQLQSLAISGSNITNGGIEHLKDLQSLESLIINSKQITDSALKIIGGLQNLEHLNLEDCSITDAGLQYLSKLKKLKHLTLSGNAITGAGLIHLKELKQLQYLVLAENQINDEGLEYLAEIKQVQDVDLSFNSVTDQGILQLKENVQLTYLRLFNTKVTDKGKRIFEQEVPECEILR